MITGTGALTFAYPAALVAFANNGLISYVVYNFTGQVLVVTFSDGHIVNASPYAFTVTTN
jgi:hypothetical protein